MLIELEIQSAEFSADYRDDKGVSHRYCTVVQRGNGYGYSLVAKTDVRGTPPQHRDASHPALYLPGLKAEVSRAN